MDTTKNIFASDELIVLGSGGGRFMATYQTRSTGGLILHALDGRIQLHIDPGPEAISAILKYQINPRKTSHVLVTHPHTDHNMSLPIIIESLQDDLSFHHRKGILMGPKGYFERHFLDPYYLDLLNHHREIGEAETHLVEPGFKITGTRAVHCDLPNQGFILEFGPLENISSEYHYRIAFTSDTAAFPDYAKIYKHVDILVANILRPNQVLCRGHLTIDEFTPLLQEISPAICILVHFGTKMHAIVSDQIRKLQQAVGDKIVVVGGEDGLHIPFYQTWNNRGQKKLDSFIA